MERIEYQRRKEGGKEGRDGGPSLGVMLVAVDLAEGTGTSSGLHYQPSAAGQGADMP